MKYFYILAVFICIAALNAKAQAQEPESKIQKFLRLTKAADDNPNDWKAQLEAGHFLLDKDSGMFNQSKAEKYYERIYHQATDYNKEIPDSVIREACMALLSMASDKKNLDKALFYADEMLRAEKMGVDVADYFLFSCMTVGWMYNLMKGDFVKSMSYMMDIRERMTKKNLQGIEHSNVSTAMLFENLYKNYKDMFGDKLIEWSFDNKKYIIIGVGDWNVEKPFIGWMSDKKGTPTILYDEDGKIHDDLHGEMEYGFNFTKEGMVAKEGTNMQMITVTPERRQQMVEAYRKYMKKAKKK